CVAVGGRGMRPLCAASSGRRTPAWRHFSASAAERAATNDLHASAIWDMRPLCRLRTCLRASEPTHATRHVIHLKSIHRPAVTLGQLFTIITPMTDIHRPTASRLRRAILLIVLGLAFIVIVSFIDGGKGVLPAALWHAPSWAPWWHAPWRLFCN